MEDLKECVSCKEIKSIFCFYADRGTRRSKCKKCFYQQQDKDKKKKNQQKYYFSNRESRLQYNYKYYESNSEKLIDYQKQYRQHYKDKVRKTRNKNHHKNKSNPLYRIKRALRSRVSAALKNKAVKAYRTVELVGCSVKDLMEFLEKKFLPGMNWENYGEWHIDHIVPCSSFDLSKSEQQKICFNYSNLQPLWAADNIRKSDSIGC
jgi:hypothetical protein